EDGEKSKRRAGEAGQGRVREPRRHAPSRTLCRRLARSAGLERAGRAPLSSLPVVRAEWRGGEAFPAVEAGAGGVVGPRVPHGYRRGDLRTRHDHRVSLDARIGPDELPVGAGDGEPADGSVGRTTHEPRADVIEP